MASKRSNFYLTREELVREIVLSKQVQREHPNRTPAECFTKDLIKYLQLMVDRYANKGQWRGYSYISDMKSEALLTLCQNAFKYNEEKFDNPFGYYTQIIKYCFITFLEKEEIVRDVKDSLWESIGMTPSYARQISNERLDHAREAAKIRAIDRGEKVEQNAKTMKALKKDVEALNERIDRLSKIITLIGSKCSTVDIDTDLEIAEILEIEDQPYTGDLAAILSLFPKKPVYKVETDVEIAGQTVICLTLYDESTKSNTKRVIRDIEPDTIARALCSIALIIRRDLLVRELREISGYNLSAARIPIVEKPTYSETDTANEGNQDYQSETQSKRKPRKRTA